ncbi:MAG: hypothetical protein DMD67_17260 [Gemmatimonadetes bacterium]|nr:MAG: hypothetical protein DMD67_17260 [Gemmatimonadota bacterium]
MDSPGIIHFAHCKLDTVTGPQAPYVKSFLGDGIAAPYRPPPRRLRRCVRGVRQNWCPIGSNQDGAAGNSGAAVRGVGAIPTKRPHASPQRMLSLRDLFARRCRERRSRAVRLVVWQSAPAPGGRQECSMSKMTDPSMTTPRSGSPAVGRSVSQLLPVEPATKPSIHILVADDERTLRESCASVLGVEGYNVTVTGKGDEALDILQRRSFDIVLLDLRASSCSRPRSTPIRIRSRSSSPGSRASRRASRCCARAHGTTCPSRSPGASCRFWWAARRTPCRWRAKAGRSASNAAPRAPPSWTIASPSSAPRPSTATRSRSRARWRRPTRRCSSPARAAAARS